MDLDVHTGEDLCCGGLGYDTIQYQANSILVGPLTAVTEAFLFFLIPSKQIIGYYLEFGHYWFLLFLFQLIFY
jgi:hypothetical protein